MAGMSIDKSLNLRGALSFLGSAMSHVGRNQLINEWSDGGFRNASVEKAYNILQLAYWKVEKELFDLNKRKQ